MIVVFIYFFALFPCLSLAIGGSQKSALKGPRGNQTKVYPVYALYFSNSKFSITPQKSTWRVAQEICKQRNSRLAHFDTEDEFYKVLKIIETSGIRASKKFWIGIHYLNQKAYYGVYTGKPASILKWSPEEPKLVEGKERRECVMLWNPAKIRTKQNKFKFSMSTENCNEQLFSICVTNCRN